VTRIKCHLNHMATYTKGMLVPGSTGEGWEMNDEDIRRLLAVVLDAVQGAGVHVLIGILKHSVADMLCCLEDTVSFLKSRTGAATAGEALFRSGVVGFTVCPPKGADLSQAAIRAALSEVLSRGLPTAVYQLPQVTENEMTPQSVSYLADRHPNLFFFKDSSGRDEVARAKMALGGVFLVRGAEGEYARSLRSGDGPYDGLLLSTANVFARMLHEIICLSQSGRKDEAESLARRVEPVVEQTFALVANPEVEIRSAF
jgi:dihydrodipicolinate synthase/N-acetylneuraminate lyase